MNIHKYIKKKGFKKVKTVLPYIHLDNMYVAHYKIVDKETILSKIQDYNRHDIAIDYHFSDSNTFSYNSLRLEDKIKLVNDVVCYKLDLKYIEIYVVVNKTWYLIFTNKETEYFRGYVKPIKSFNYNILEEHISDETLKRSFIIENLLK